MLSWSLPSGEVVTTPIRFAKELGVSRHIVYVWVQKGMPAIRSDDGKILILYREAVKWLQDQKSMGNVRLDAVPVLWRNVYSCGDSRSNDVMRKVLTLIAAGASAYAIYQVLKVIFERKEEKDE